MVDRRGGTARRSAIRVGPRVGVGPPITEGGEASIGRRVLRLGKDHPAIHDVIAQRVAGLEAKCVAYALGTVVRALESRRPMIIAWSTRSVRTSLRRFPAETKKGGRLVAILHSTHFERQRHHNQQHIIYTHVVLSPLRSSVINLVGLSTSRLGGIKLVSSSNRIKPRFGLFPPVGPPYPAGSTASACP